MAAEVPARDVKRVLLVPGNVNWHTPPSPAGIAIILRRLHHVPHSPPQLGLHPYSTAASTPEIPSAALLSSSPPLSRGRYNSSRRVHPPLTGGITPPEFTKNSARIKLKSHLYYLSLHDPESDPHSKYSSSGTDLLTIVARIVHVQISSAPESFEFQLKTNRDLIAHHSNYSSIPRRFLKELVLPRADQNEFSPFQSQPPLPPPPEIHSDRHRRPP